MSHSLSTSQVETNLGQNHFGSVAVASVGVSAGLAHKNSFGQFKSLLGSCSASGTCHRCTGPTAPFRLILAITLQVVRCAWPQSALSVR